jgi:excisionase family DNA binding protein
MPEDWITTAEAAQLSGYHVNHVRRLIVAGKVRARKFGPVWQVSKSDFLAYVQRLEQAGQRRGPKPR